MLGQSARSSIPAHVTQRQACPAQRRALRHVKLTASASRASVYVAATHLEGMEGIAAVLQSMGRGVPDVLTVHSMTIVEEESPDAPREMTYTVFDFLPERPTAPGTVLALIGGGKVPGVTRERRLRRLPRRKCSLVAEALPAQACQAARRFNALWPCELQLLRHDCHHHTAALLQHLTGRAVSLNAALLFRGRLPES